MNKKQTRRSLREKVLQILYAYEMNGEGLTNLTEGVIADLEEEEDREFCRRLVNKVIASRKILDSRIGEKVDNWELNRLALIDKVLLRMGIGELLFFPDIPPKVSINEVIEIAKNYSTPNSGKFINGILDTILSDLKNSGTLVKSGRGLLDEAMPKKTKKSKHTED